MPRFDDDPRAYRTDVNQYEIDEAIYLVKRSRMGFDYSRDFNRVLEILSAYRQVCGPYVRIVDHTRRSEWGQDHFMREINRAPIQPKPQIEPKLDLKLTMPTTATNLPSLKKD